MISKRPFYRVVRAFQETYHMRGKWAIYHIIICMSCGHWRRIQNKRTPLELIGRLFSCERCKQ